jgi:hypothetical protein
MCNAIHTYSYITYIQYIHTIWLYWTHIIIYIYIYIQLAIGRSGQKISIARTPEPELVARFSRGTPPQKSRPSDTKMSWVCLGPSIDAAGAQSKSFETTECGFLVSPSKDDQRCKHDQTCISRAFLVGFYFSIWQCVKTLVPLVNPKIAGKWMFIPPKMVLIGIDP